MPIIDMEKIGDVYAPVRKVQGQYAKFLQALGEMSEPVAPNLGKQEQVAEERTGEGWGAFWKIVLWLVAGVIALSCLLAIGSAL